MNADMNQINNTTTNSGVMRAEMTAAKKSRCGVEGCMDRVAKIVGDCKYCMGKFCGKHRMVEAHACPNMESCRQAHFQKNSAKLLTEKCTNSKV